ncbi:hypothetical protein R6Q59_000039 [Mikania micrantha]
MVVVRQSEERIPLRTWIRTSAERKSLGAWGRHAKMRVVGDRRSPITGSEDVGDASHRRALGVTGRDLWGQTGRDASSRSKETRDDTSYPSVWLPMIPSPINVPSTLPLTYLLSITAKDFFGIDTRQEGNTECDSSSFTNMTEKLARSDQVKTDGIQQNLKYLTDNLGTAFFDVAYGVQHTFEGVLCNSKQVSEVHLFARKKGPFNGWDLDAMAIKYGMKAQRYNFPYGSNNPSYYMLRFSE